MTCKARTKDWTTRRREYWHWLEDKARDERQLGPDAYDWVERGDAHRRSAELFSRIPAENLDRTDYEPGVPGREAEAWKLRSVIAVYRRARILNEFHGFMELPREVRDIIYHHSLAQGKVIVGPKPVRHWQLDSGDPYTRYEGDVWGYGMFEGEYSNVRQTHRPLGLICGVSRLVHDEAFRIFCGHNQLVFPAGQCRWAGNDLCGSAKKPELSIAHLARDVSYTFDMRDTERLNDRDTFIEQHDIKDGVDGESLTPQEALQMLHNRKVLWLEFLWAERIDFIKQMTLERLQLSFEECYCCIGCCRKVLWVLDRLTAAGPLPGFGPDDESHVYCVNGWACRPPKIIEVIGWVNDKEIARIGEKLALLPGSEAIEVRFIESFESDSWERHH